jgi:hypothetical protein
MLFDRGDTPARARLFKNLNTPIDVTTELKTLRFHGSGFSFPESNDRVYWSVEPLLFSRLRRISD